MSRGNRLLVPPFDLTVDPMYPNEKLENAALRLSRVYGPEMKLVGPITVPEHTDAPDLAYLVENHHYLDRSEFLVPYNEVAMALSENGYLSSIERKLLLSAANLLRFHANKHTQSSTDTSTIRLSRAIVSELRTNIWQDTI